ncbi:hypothetical protein J3A76_006597 [Methylobacterium sp. PvP109]|nr:hypothetical protein [Methylobacterium sp. PvP109]
MLSRTVAFSAMTADIGLCASITRKQRPSLRSSLRLRVRSIFGRLFRLEAARRYFCAWTLIPSDLLLRAAQLTSIYHLARLITAISDPIEGGFSRSASGQAPMILPRLTRSRFHYWSELERRSD